LHFGLWVTIFDLSQIGKVSMKTIVMAFAAGILLSLVIWAAVYLLVRRCRARTTAGDGHDPAQAADSKPVGELSFSWAVSIGCALLAGVALILLAAIRASPATDAKILNFLYLFGGVLFTAVFLPLVWLMVRNKQLEVEIAMRRKLTEDLLCQQILLQESEQELQQFAHRMLYVREEEKGKLSAVLHHETGALALSAQAYLQAAKEEIGKNSPATAIEYVDKTRDSLVQSVGRLKSAAVELRPPELDILGLAAALREHCDHMMGGTAVKIMLEDAVDDRLLGGSKAIILFRVAQEALNNALKHAKPQTVAIRLEAVNGQVRLVVQDDGKGFEPELFLRNPGSHLGLRVTREMVAAEQGQYFLRSAPGKGTAVEVLLPLSKSEEDA
jgi:signal transduction histidine kinase